MTAITFCNGSSGSGTMGQIMLLGKIRVVDIELFEYPSIHRGYCVTYKLGNLITL